MKPEVRKRVRRYGIPIDLVILATGAAMLFPHSSPVALVTLYLIAVIASAFRLGWRSGLTAMAFALLVMLAGYGDVLTGAADATFIVVSLAAISGAEIVRSRRTAVPSPAAIGPPAADEERERLRLEKEALERKLELERREVEARIAREREAAQRELEQKLDREKQELERRLAAEREATKREAEARLERERVAREAEAVALQREKEELERRVAEREEAKREAEAKLEAERIARQAEQKRERLDRENETIATLQREKEELERRLTEEREQAKRELEERVERERAAALHGEREELEKRIAAERAAIEKEYEEQLRAERAKAPRTNLAPRRGVLSGITSWLSKPKPAPPPIAAKRPAPKPAAAPPAPRPKPQPAARERKPRVLMLERRRGTADAVAPRLRDAGIDVQIVERWIDAVDEIFRFRPDAMFVDSELPDFLKVHKSITEQAPRLPIFVTAASHAGLPNVPRAASVIRPYSGEAIAKLAREAMATPQLFLDRQVRAPQPPRPTPERAQPHAAPQPESPAPPQPQPGQPSEDDRYEVTCFNCRVAFDATDADWCSCLTKERTLVCTNCLTCFCKAPPSYKEKFWVEAPARLFERKTAELRKQEQAVESNLPPEQVRRPLVLLVEDDEDIQAIVQRVCSNLGYGFVSAPNGQDGLNVARLYKPNLILSDAFMPKLDGREMCRILKEESIIPDCKMVVMTGLYTDTKYKNEALKRFHIDDYLSKPVSITDLINLLQKHLEGLAGTPPQEDLHELHRKEMEAAAEEMDDENSIALMDLLDAPAEPRLPAAASVQPSGRGGYEVCCFSCGKTFDANEAEWCTCLGRDQTLVCPHCSTCFCKAPAAYKERFWIDAPSTLFERKMIGSKRSVGGKNNPSPMEVRRPLILLVEDDENIQLIVKTVVTTLGYGFIVAANGQEGLSMAREYNPDLILSDAFMPKLDGREMCRLLKEDPATARTKAIIMTGLYTDRKYRNEALSYFKVDDYVAKPVAVDDLIKLMKKHLPQEAQPTM